jgi:hypothetical protein
MRRMIGIGIPINHRSSPRPMGNLLCESLRKQTPSPSEMFRAPPKRDSASKARVGAGCGGLRKIRRRTKTARTLQAAMTIFARENALSLAARHIAEKIIELTQRGMRSSPATTKMGRREVGRIISLDTRFGGRPAPSGTNLIGSQRLLTIDPRGNASSACARWLTAQFSQELGEAVGEWLRRCVIFPQP